jgi:hypothetical protein
MLVGALGSWPYGYYILLRWIVCAVAIVFALHGNFVESAWAIWVFGSLAILFNPLVPVHLSRNAWAPIDVASAIAFVVGAVLLKEEKKIGGESDQP